MHRSRPALLRDTLRAIVDRTFNQVTVDGDPSTNDTVLVLANGAEGGAADRRRRSRSAAFAEGLEAVCRSLAEQIAADGEGAQHRIDVSVIGARNDREARLVARTVASSSLVKTAVHGADPNWGRIAAAAGRSGARLDPDRLAVRIGAITVYDGAPLAFDERAASRGAAREGGRHRPRPAAGLRHRDGVGLRPVRRVRLDQQRVPDVTAEQRPVTIKIGGVAGQHAESLSLARPVRAARHGRRPRRRQRGRRVEPAPRPRATHPRRAARHRSGDARRGGRGARAGWSTRGWWPPWSAPGRPAVGLTGADGGLLRLRRRDPVLGEVGEVVGGGHRRCSTRSSAEACCRSSPRWAWTRRGACSTSTPTRWPAPSPPRAAGCCCCARTSPASSATDRCCSTRLTPPPRSRCSRTARHRPGCGRSCARRSWRRGRAARCASWTGARHRRSKRALQGESAGTMVTAA